MRKLFHIGLASLLCLIVACNGDSTNYQMLKRGKRAAGKPSMPRSMVDSFKNWTLEYRNANSILLTYYEGCARYSMIVTIKDDKLFIKDLSGQSGVPIQMNSIYSANGFITTKRIPLLFVRDLVDKFIYHKMTSIRWNCNNCLLYIKSGEGAFIYNSDSLRDVAVELNHLSLEAREPPFWYQSH